MRFLALLIALMLPAAGAAGRMPGWEVSCRLDDPVLRYCAAERAIPSGAAVAVVIVRNENRTWQQPSVMLSFAEGQGEVARYRFPGGATREWGHDDLATLQILPSLHAASDIVLVRTDGHEEKVSLADFPAAHAELLRLATARGFRADDGFPLDRLERATWFARRHIEAALHVPGSAQFDYLEAFPQAGRHILVCVRYSAQNRLGLRLRASGLMLRLQEREMVFNRETHRVAGTVEQTDENARHFETLWHEGCRDR